MTAQPIEMGPHDLEEYARQWLVTARNRLNNAVSITTVAAIRADAATLQEAVKQQRLPKGIQDDALEMVRRAEYALGKAVKTAQDMGKLAQRTGYFGKPEIPTVTEVTGLSRQTLSDLYPLSEGVPEDEFEQALADARKEMDLSRNNIIRKVGRRKPPKASNSGTLESRIDLVRKLASTGYDRKQMAEELGVHRDTLTRFLNKHKISVSADTLRQVRRADSSRIARETVNTMEGLLMALPMIDYTTLNKEEVDEWTASLDKSLRELRRFHNKLKEAVR